MGWVNNTGKGRRRSGGSGGTITGRNIVDFVLMGVCIGVSRRQRRKQEMRHTQKEHFENSMTLCHAQSHTSNCGNVLDHARAPFFDIWLVRMALVVAAKA
jgi:hypothetical protein